MHTRGDSGTSVQPTRSASRGYPPAQLTRLQHDVRQAGPADSPPEARVAASVHAASGLEAGSRFRPWILARLPLLLLIGDLAALVCAAVVAGAPVVLAQLFVVGSVALLQAKHLYRPRLTLALTDDLLMLFGATGAGTVFGVLTYSATGGDVTAGRALVLALTAGAMLVAMRAGTYGGIRAARRRGWVSHRAVIVGTDETAARLATALEDHPDHGLRVVGFVGRVHEGTPASVRRAILTDDPAMLPVLASQHRAGVVLMTMSGVDSDDVLESLRLWGPPGGLTIFLVPPLFQMLHGGALDRVRDIALIPIRAPVTRRVAWRVKTLFDSAVAAALLFLLAPVLAGVAAAVRRETGPGVLFKQTRVGLGGRPFTLYKFRSLRPTNGAESAKHWSVADDDRIGPVGRFIRKSSLDELPQLVNVLWGEMSLVGPRPERPYFVEQFGDTFDGYALRHRVRPGLTGWAAVSGLRGDTSIQDRAHFDNVYIDNWSLQFDFKILALTALSVVKGTGA